ncbi:MAG: sulfatase-like hydrolase/transferase, partial [Armatimonadota bacterium]
DPLIWQNGKIGDDGKGRYGPEVYTDFLIDFMQRHRQQPFVAYYSMALCHDVTDDLDHHVPFGPGKDRYDSYAEMAESMDRMVGKLIAALRRLRLQERTLVLFTGDNGTAKSSIARVEGGRLTRDPVFSLRNGVEIRGGKGELTDGGTRVPLIANWPGTIPAGQVVHDLVDFSDFFPTLADIGGAALPDDVTLDGRSFASRLRGTGPAPRPWAFCESGNNYWARTQRWKLLNDGRLIDMEADPREKQPIRPAADTAESAAARRQLLQAFDQLGLKPERASDG